jgi:Fe2+ or Zn2+ uptake regulation protein
MTDSDVYILQLLMLSGVALPAFAIHHNVQTRLAQSMSEKTVRRRLDKLVEEGYVVHEGDKENLYAISDNGMKLISGRIATTGVETRDLEEPE